MFGQFPVKQKKHDRYLGQILHSGGATKEIKSIIEEFQMQAMGGMMAAWILWERAIIPSLLSRAGTWFGLNECKKAVDLCDKTFIGEL
jgi:hypothetical protein